MSRIDKARCLIIFGVLVFMFVQPVSGVEKKIYLKDVAKGIGGFRIVGSTPGGVAGADVKPAGDVNGDRLDDLLIGTGWEYAVYVVFGRQRSGKVRLGDVANGIGGFMIFGGGIGQYYSGMASAGDLDGDGLSDTLVGARLDGEGAGQAGAAYLVFGKRDTEPVDVESDFRCIKIVGYSSNARAGSAVASGDVNGDGRPDLLVGAPLEDAAAGDEAGAAYVIFGKAFRKAPAGALP